MAKFTIGDHIQCISHPTSTGYYVVHHSHGEIINSDSTGMWIRDERIPYEWDEKYEKYVWYSNLDDWELVPTQYQTLETKVGDEFIVLKTKSHSHSVRVGERVRVMSVEAGGQVECSNGFCLRNCHKWADYCTTEYLKPVTREEPHTTHQTLTPKVGDKFKVIKKQSAMHADPGFITTVTNADSWWITSTDSYGGDIPWNREQFTTEYLRPIETAWQTPLSFWGKSIREQIEAHQVWMDPCIQTIKPNIKTKMTNFIKKLTQSADDKALETAGFIDNCGDITRTGNEALTSLIFQEKKEALVKLANQVISEAKE